MNLSSPITPSNTPQTTKHKSFHIQHTTHYPFYKINLSQPEPFTSEYKRNLKDLFSKTQKLLSFGNNVNFSYNFNLHRSWLNLPNKPLLTRNSNKLKDDNKLIQSYKYINTKSKCISLSPAMPNKSHTNKHKHIIIYSKNTSSPELSKTQSFIEQHHHVSPSSTKTNSKSISPKAVKKFPFNYKTKSIKHKRNEQYGKLTNALKNIIYNSECFTKKIENSFNAISNVNNREIKTKIKGFDLKDFTVLVNGKKRKDKEDQRIKYLKYKKDVCLRYGLVNLIDFGDCYSKLDASYCLQNKNDIYKRYNKLRKELHIIKENKSHTDRDKSFNYIFKNNINAIDLYYKTKDKLATLLPNKINRSSSI